MFMSNIYKDNMDLFPVCFERMTAASEQLLSDLWASVLPGASHSYRTLETRDACYTYLFNVSASLCFMTPDQEKEKRGVKMSTF